MAHGPSFSAHGHSHIVWPVNNALRDFWRFKTGTELQPGQEREAVALMADVPVEEVVARPDGKFAVPVAKPRPR